MKFTEKYPDAEPGSDTLHECRFYLGVRGLACTWCRDATPWVDSFFCAHVCSEECFGEMERHWAAGDTVLRSGVFQTREAWDVVHAARAAIEAAARRVSGLRVDPARLPADESVRLAYLCGHRDARIAARDAVLSGGDDRPNNPEAA